MNWDIVARVGDTDTYEPEGPRDVLPLVVPLGSSHAPRRMREHVLSSIRTEYGRCPGEAAVDFSHLAMAVYSADLLIPRATASDRWTRDFLLHLPVRDLACWQGAQETLEGALSFLTGDCWSLSLRSRSPGDDAQPCNHQRRTGLEADAVVLCSGGLDSLAGSMARTHDGAHIALVGQYGGGATSKFQHQVMDALHAAPSVDVTKHSFHVLPPQMSGDGEDTMRSRSLLFLGLGMAVADTLGDRIPLVVPENGLIGLNVPLTGPRIGSASTRTTHPYFISSINSILEAIGLTHEIELPYRFTTKGEMLRQVDSDLLRKIMPATMSCSHPEQSRWEGETPGQHCGYCVPCMIRRAAVLHAGLTEFDAPYTYDVSDPGVHLTGKKRRDPMAVRMSLERMKRQSVTRDGFAVLDSGPLPAEELHEYASVYRRGMLELAQLLGVIF